MRSPSPKLFLHATALVFAWQTVVIAGQTDKTNQPAAISTKSSPTSTRPNGSGPKRLDPKAPPTTKADIAIVDEANKLIAKNQFKQAFELLDRYTKQHPGSSYVECQRIFTEHCQNRFDDVIRDVDHFLTFKDHRLEHDGLRLRGYAFYRQGKFDLALKDYNRAIALSPNNAELYKLRSSSLEKLGQPKKALADSTTAASLQPHDTWALRGKASLESQLKMHKEACATYLQFVQSGGDIDTTLTYLHDLIVSGDNQNSLWLIDKLLPAHKDNAQLRDLRANIYARTNRFADAADEFKEAANYGMDNLKIRALMNLKAGRDREAIEAFNAIIAKHPNEPDAYCHRGEAKFRTGDIEGALADFNHDTKCMKKSSAHLIMRAECYMKLNQPKLAEPDFALGSQLNPSIDNYFHHAHCLSAVGRHEDAARVYSKVIEKKPLGEGAFAERADCYRRLKKYDLAIQDCNSALTLSQNDRMMNYCRGLCYLASNRPQQAVEDLTQALNQKGLEGQVLLERAKAYDMLGDKDKAAADRAESKKYAQSLETDFFPREIK